MTDDELTERLRRTLAQRAERVTAGPDLADLAAHAATDVEPARSRPRSRRAPMLAAAMLAAGSIAWVGYTAIAADPHEGAFNPGQPLYCSGIQTMEPAAAAAELRDRGYEVQWQYHHQPGDTAIRTEPPADAVIIEVAIVDDGATALVLAEDFDATDPLHRRLANGETQCDHPVGGDG